MSHFVAIKTSVRDVNALRKACEELGLELVEKGTARGYASNKLKAEYVIKLKGPFEVVEGLRFDIRHLAFSVAHRLEWLRDVWSLLVSPLTSNGETVRLLDRRGHGVVVKNSIFGLR